MREGSEVGGCASVVSGGYDGRRGENGGVHRSNWLGQGSRVEEERRSMVSSEGRFVEGVFAGRIGEEGTWRWSKWPTSRPHRDIYHLPRLNSAVPFPRVARVDLFEDICSAIYQRVYPLRRQRNGAWAPLSFPQFMHSFDWV
ncbi:hypothetical protein GW17_00049640 [Ensete ventricosum]|nr:hypothetical protein GW17_00049640 [Ensete ventricosum]